MAGNGSNDLGTLPAYSSMGGLAAWPTSCYALKVTATGILLLSCSSPSRTHSQGRPLQLVSRPDRLGDGKGSPVRPRRQCKEGRCLASSFVRCAGRSSLPSVTTPGDQRSNGPSSGKLWPRSSHSISAGGMDG